MSTPTHPPLAHGSKVLTNNIILLACVQVQVGRPSEVDEIFDAISYSKGASVIRMLHDYIGDAVSTGVVLRSNCHISDTLSTGVVLRSCHIGDAVSTGVVTLMML